MLEAKQGIFSRFCHKMDIWSVVRVISSHFRSLEITPSHLHVCQMMPKYL